MPRANRRGRRGNGEGSIFQTKDGRYAAVITLGRTHDGKQVRRRVYAKTRYEAAEKLKKMLPFSGRGTVPDAERITLEAWLHRYIKLVEADRRPSTLEKYHDYLKKIVDEMGKTLLSKVSAYQIQHLYSQLSSRGLSPSVRQHLHDFLNASFKRALKLGIIDRSPMVAVDRPRGGRVIHPKALSPDEIKRLLEAAKGERYGDALYLIVTVGLRIGEAVGLKWSDLEGNKLFIQRTASLLDERLVFGPPKTERGKRDLYLPRDVMEKLEHLKYLQTVELSMIGKRPEFMFCTDKGTPLYPNNLRRAYRRMVTKAGLSKVRVHDLRHTFTTLARDAGLDLEVVAQVLGQDPRVTLTVYSHITESRKRKASLELSELLEGKRRDSNES
jgi:integrase